MTTKLRTINLALRGIMEAGIVGGLIYWGFYTGDNIEIKIILGIGTPFFIFGFWSTYDFHNFGKLSEVLRLIQEMILSGLASTALYITGQHFSGLALAIISIIHHILVYLLGDTLLK